MQPGHFILMVLGVSLAVGTVLADWRRNHAFHPDWPAHARFHCVLYSLMNVGAGIMVVWLMTPYSSSIPGSVRVGMSVTILLWSTLILWMALLFPGASPIADGEKVIAKIPISYWISFFYLAGIGVGYYFT